MKVTRWACVAVTSAIIGCGGGGGDGGTTNPPPPPPPPTTQTLASITTSVTSLNLAAGNSQTIVVSALDTQGRPISGFTATFTSTAATIAEVDGNGSVLGLRSGAATINISVSVGGVTRTAAVAVTVTGNLPNSASVSTTSGDIFTPSNVLIGIGGQVTWTFGPTTHNVTFSTAGSPSNIAATYSTSDTRTFPQAGNFSYNCTLHAGMSGQVMVR